MRAATASHPPRLGTWWWRVTQRVRPGGGLPPALESDTMCLVRHQLHQCRHTTIHMMVQQQQQHCITCHSTSLARRSRFTQQQHRNSTTLARRPFTTRLHNHSYRACSDPIVTTSWLQEHLDEVSLLDVRGRVDTAEVAPGEERSTYVADRNAYLDGHIPGAVFWDWRTDGIDMTTAVPVQLQCDADLLAAALEAKGVSSDRLVVVRSAVA